MNTLDNVQLDRRAAIAFGAALYPIPGVINIRLLQRMVTALHGDPANAAKLVEHFRHVDAHPMVAYFRSAPHQFYADSVEQGLPIVPRLEALMKASEAQGLSTNMRDEFVCGLIVAARLAPADRAPIIYNAYNDVADHGTGILKSVGIRTVLTFMNDREQPGATLEELQTPHPPIGGTTLVATPDDGLQI